MIKTIVGHFPLCVINCLSVLFLFNVSTHAAGSTKNDDLCRSKATVDWIVALIVEEAQVKRQIEVFLVEPDKIDLAKKQKKVDPKKLQLLKDAEAKAFGPDSKTVVLVEVPGLLGVHAKSGAHTCQTGIDIYEPEENKVTGSVRLIERYLISDRLEVNDFVYRIVPKDRKGRMLIALHNFNESNSLPSAESIENLLADVDSGKYRPKYKYKRVKAYMDNIEWEGLNQPGFSSQTFFGIIQ